MRIAQLSTPFIQVPPEGYGGTELVVSLITEELVARGYDVTLFASGDSKTRAKLVAEFAEAIHYDKMESLFSPQAAKLFWMHSLPSLMHISKLIDSIDSFDIIHNHFHYLPLFFTSQTTVPFVHTYHGDFSVAEESVIERMVLEKFSHQNWVAISESQKKNCQLGLRFVSVIHHGIQLQQFSYEENPENHLVWLGRITEKKGTQDAIEVAKKVGMHLTVAGVVHERDTAFFQQKIEPQVDNDTIRYVANLNLTQKVDLLKRAKVLLYPIHWEEPFGMVMIEAMACGTPVIAYNHGSVPEIVKDGETGFIINASETNTQGDFSIKAVGFEGLCEAVKRITSMSSQEYAQMRKACRKRVEDYFTVERMVDSYDALYKKILSTS